MKFFPEPNPRPFLPTPTDPTDVFFTHGIDAEGLPLRMIVACRAIGCPNPAQADHDLCRRCEEEADIRHYDSPRLPDRRNPFQAKPASSVYRRYPKWLVCAGQVFLLLLCMAVLGCIGGCIDWLVPVH